MIRWPLSKIGPYLKDKNTADLYTAIGISSIIAWWVLAITHGVSIAAELTTGFTRQELLAAMSDQAKGELQYDILFWFVWTIFVLVVSGGRALAYLTGTWPPISLAGRLATGRLIIPGYDRIFVAPLAMLIFGFAGPITLYMIHAPEVLIPAVSVWGVVMLGMSIGPSLETWRLTGCYRIKPWTSQKQDEARKRSTRATEVRGLSLGRTIK